MSDVRLDVDALMDEMWRWQIADEIVKRERQEARAKSSQVDPETVNEAWEHLRFTMQPSPTERHFWDCLDRSKKLLSTDVAEARRVAEQALETAEQVRKPSRAMARIRATTAIGQALRRAGELRRAQQMANRTHNLLSELAYYDAHTAADVYTLKGQIIGALDDYEEAVLWYETAIDELVDFGDPSEAGAVRILLSSALRRLGRPKEAVEQILEALRNLDRDRNGRTVFAGLQNLVLAYVELGYSDAARIALQKTRKLYAEDMQVTDRYRCDWAEARIQRLEGRQDEAEDLLEIVATGFLDLGLTYDAALAYLEIAGWQLTDGRIGAARLLAEECHKAFQAAGATTKAVAALALLRGSASAAEAATALKALEKLNKDAWTASQNRGPGAQAY